jgi:hypothetical protein
VFDASDPRASLAASAAAAAHGPFTPATYYHFYDAPPQEDGADGPTWYARSQTLIVAYSETSRGATLRRTEQPDEYAVLLPDRDTAAIIEARSEQTMIDGLSLTFVPPGASLVRLPEGGRVVRLFTTSARDIVDSCAAPWRNNPRIAPPRPWPDPVGGFRIRSYSLEVPPEDGRFGRIFRSSAFMVNYLEPSHGPRDPTRLSPHHHDDFEQCSLALEGEFVHHLRWPWTTNRHEWIEDEHVHCRSPSVAVVPPPAIHTTEAVGPELNVLVDIFCPPRLDFSERPGWVLNASDYPVPGASGGA